MAKLKTQFNDLVESSGGTPSILFYDKVQIIATTNTIDLTQYDGKVVFIDVENLPDETNLSLTLPTNIQFYFSGEWNNISNLILNVGTQYDGFGSMYFSSNSGGFAPYTEISGGTLTFNNSYLFSGYQVNLFSKIGYLMHLIQSTEL
jgi:hypothetical protein